MQFDYLTGTLATDSGEIHLQPCEADFVEALRSCDGRLAAYDFLRDRLWRDPPKRWKKEIQCHVVNLRKKTPIKIKTHWGQGYSLPETLEEIAPPDFRCDIDINLNTLEGHLFNALLKKAGRVAGRDYLITELWRGNEPDWAESVLGVEIHNLRKRLAPRGWGIKTIYKRGYMLVAL